MEFLEENEKSTDPEHHTPMFRLQHAGIYCVLLGLVTLVGGSLQNTFFVSVKAENKSAKAENNDW